MISIKSGILSKSKNTFSLRRFFAPLGGLLAVAALCAGTTANAQPVHFHYNGGHWSHGYHTGWHRYWGGPSIGFYYAPAPVYVVSGYADPYYYSGPNYWYSNPSFGLSLNFGGGYYGGGYYGGGYHGGYHGGGYHGGGYHGGGYHSAGVHGGGFHGGGFHGGGGSFHGGGGHGGGRR